MATDAGILFYRFDRPARDSRGDASITVTAPSGSNCLVTLTEYDQANRRDTIDSRRLSGGASFTFAGLANGFDYRIECRSLSDNNVASDRVTATTAGTSHTAAFASAGAGGGGVDSVSVASV